MNTEKPQSERSTTRSSESPAPTTAPSTEDALPELHEGTDHETKCLRSAIVGGRDRTASVLFYRGPFRIYSARKEEAPRLIAIDNGSHAWEIRCKSVTINCHPLKSSLKAEAVYPEPAYTLEGFGMVEVDANGVAVIS